MKELALEHYYRYQERYQAAGRHYYQTHKEQRQEHSRLHRATHRERLRIYRARDRKRVFAFYGTACACCGESCSLMLNIDHINGCTKAQRTVEGVGLKLYRYLIRNHFPDGYRTLCFNCNQARDKNGGICPHETGCFAKEAKSPRQSPQPAFSFENTPQ